MSSKPPELNDGKQYFVGVGGEPLGPFTTEAILNQIQSEKLPQEALLWSEGYAGWKSLISFKIFADAFQTGDGAALSKATAANMGGFRPLTSQLPSLGLTEKKGASETRKDLPAMAPTISSPTNFKSSTKEAEDGEKIPLHSKPKPIFQRKDSSFDDGYLLRHRMKILVGSFSVMFLLTVAVFYWWAKKAEPEPLSITQFSVPVITSKNQRNERLRKALSELLIKPNDSISELRNLVKENPNDKVAADAITAATQHYQSSQQPEQAGNFLMLANRPKEAAKFFMQGEVPNYAKAVGALELVYKSSSSPEDKFESLDQQIKIYLGSLNNLSKASEKIQLLSKEFPNRTHPYSFYLLSDSEKMVDLFGQLSHAFVKSFMTHLDAQFPQISLVSRPKVELKQDKQGNFRIVGSYNGEITLNRDQLSGIYMTFWNWNGKWYLVDTNLTVERREAAGLERKKHLNDVYTAANGVAYLSQMFQSEFPNRALHERAGLRELSTDLIDN